MKKVIGVISALSIICYFGSCKVNNCTTPVISKIDFFSSVSTSIVPDTSATLVKSTKGTSFGQISEVFPNILLTRVDYNKRLTIPDKGTESYDYDWMVTLHPSGRVYKITAIQHETTTSKTSECTNTVSYKINDSLVTVPGNPYSSVPNFVSDIQIQYY